MRDEEQYDEEKHFVAFLKVSGHNQFIANYSALKFKFIKLVTRSQEYSQGGSKVVLYVH